jgi:hypothetical protein
MLARLTDAKANNNLIQKPWCAICLRAFSRVAIKVITGVKNQLVLTAGKSLAFQQSFLAAAIGIGCGLRDGVFQIMGFE